MQTATFPKMTKPFLFVLLILTVLVLQSMPARLQEPEPLSTAEYQSDLVELVPEADNASLVPFYSETFDASEQPEWVLNESWSVLPEEGVL